MISRRTLFAATLMGTLLAGCGGGGDDDFSSSGSSSTSAPSSFTSKRLVETVTSNDGKSTTIAVGRSITYNFVDSNTVMGDGLATRLTSDWSYSTSGSTATVTLRYSNGTSVDTLTFNSPTSGTYVSRITFTSGQQNEHRGTFTVSSI
jgi:hypothetical protein